MDYIVPSDTRIGHIHLKVSDIDRALTFYRDLLGFEITQRYGTQAVFLSAGGYHHHIGLNTWYSKDAGATPFNSTGLFHTAIVYPTRKDLAFTRKNMKDFNISQADKILLRKRAIIESVNDELKNICKLQHTRHRSINNFLMNTMGALCAYHFFPKKPSLNIVLKKTITNYF